MAREPRERATLMVLERVGWMAVRATDHAVEAGVATRRAGVFGWEPVSGAPRNVPAGGGHRSRRAGVHAGPFRTTRAGIEAVRGTRRREGQRHEERGAQRDPGTEDRVHQHAQQARASEASAL